MIILNNLIQEHTAVTSQLESPLFTSVLPLRLTKIPLKTNIKKRIPVTGMVVTLTRSGCENTKPDEH